MPIKKAHWLKMDPNPYAWKTDKRQNMAVVTSNPSVIVVSLYFFLVIQLQISVHFILNSPLQVTQTLSNTPSGSHSNFNDNVSTHNWLKKEKHTRFMKNFGATHNYTIGENTILIPIFWGHSQFGIYILITINLISVIFNL